MSVSNLSGTKWVWNDTPNLANVVSTTTIFSVIFTSNETLYDYGIRLTASGILSYILYNGRGGATNNRAYRTSTTTWDNVAYKTIVFANDAGIDATNATLISILETYATQIIEPSDSSVSVLLGNTEIASITGSGTVTIATNETFCTSDITVDFTSYGNSFVTVQLGNSTIATLSNTGTISLATNETFLTDDITVVLQ